MNPAEIGRSYDEIAHRWRNEPHIQLSGLPQFEHALRFIRARGRALDVGCGCSGRFIDRLLAAGFSCEGVDVSARMIALARERHPEITFHLADIAEWPVPHRYDFLIAWDSIWHLPLAGQEPLMRKLCAALEPGGVLLFTAGGLDGPGEKSDSCMGPPVHYSTPGIPRLLALLDECGCGCRHLEFDQYPELHLCVIAQKAGAPAPGAISG